MQTNRDHTPPLPLVASLLRRWKAPAPTQPVAEEWGVEVPYLSFVPAAQAGDEATWPLAA